jgi:hypothetical protein
MMRKNIPAMVSAGRPAGSIRAIMIIPFNVVLLFITERGPDAAGG